MKHLILFLTILCSPLIAVCQTSIKCSIVGYGGGEIRSASTVTICCLGEPIIGDIGNNLRAGFIGVLENVNGNGVPGPDSPTILNKFSLSAPYPNPFNPSTRLTFGLPKAGRVELAVYDLNGRQVAKLVDEVKPAGTHRLTWDSNAFPAGVYLMRMETSTGFNAVTKAVLVK
jgi:hypothetical protein